LHDTTTKVLGQNVDEILTYFVCNFLSIHIWMIIELHGDNNYNFLTTMDNISCHLSQINLHGTHGISITFQHKYISMHKSKSTILILAKYHHNIYFSPIWLKHLFIFVFLVAKFSTKTRLSTYYQPIR